MRAALPLFVGMAGLLNSAADPPTELSALQGTWKFVKSVQAGDSIPEELLKRKHVTIKGDKITADEGGLLTVFYITIDPVPKPPHINLRPEKQKVYLPGIYKFENERLTICVSIEDDPAKFVRPKEFAGKENPRTGLIILERVKK